MVFVPNSLTFTTDPRVVELVIKSVPLEYPHKLWLINPLSGCNLTNQERLIDYSLSRERYVVAYAFRIVANHFHCLLTTMAQEPDTVTSIVLACYLAKHYTDTLFCRSPGTHRLRGP